MAKIKGTNNVYRKRIMKILSMTDKPMSATDIDNSLKSQLNVSGRRYTLSPSKSQLHNILSKSKCFLRCADNGYESSISTGTYRYKVALWGLVGEEE
jgi:hypothetical protein